jgi:hypothetical protein
VALKAVSTTSLGSFNDMTRGQRYGSDFVIALASPPYNFIAITGASGKIHISIIATI